MSDGQNSAGSGEPIKSLESNSVKPLKGTKPVHDHREVVVERSTNGLD